MPRKIPDLEANILRAAGELFSEKGYTEVNMKDVAHRAGTSVGNLYNYYPTKKDLFLAGRRIWIEQFDTDFLSTELAETAPREALERALLKLADFFERKRGMVDEFLEAAKLELSPEELKTMRLQMRREFMENIVGRLDPLLRRCLAKRASRHFESDEMRSTIMLISMVKSIGLYFPGEGETNRIWIRQFLDLLCTEE